MGNRAFSWGHCNAALSAAITHTGTLVTDAVRHHHCFLSFRTGLVPGSVPTSKFKTVQVLDIKCQSQLHKV